MEFFKQQWRNKKIRMAVGVVVGGGMGLAYYLLIGCKTGTCPMTSHPVVSTLWGGAIGMLALS